MDRLRRMIEIRGKQRFELMEHYMNPLWNQMTMQVDCKLVDNRLAEPVQLHPAVLKRIHRGNPVQQARIGVSRYLW